jgi:aryl-alcohol dehydrogenase-like predicted oxidoreductase
VHEHQRRARVAGLAPQAQKIQLGQSDLRVTPICLGTMTFGEQVNEADSHAIMDRALEREINFLDTAEMYSVPARKETFGATETIIGNWLAARPGMRQKIVLATKVAGPSRGMPWVRAGAGMTGEDIIASCEASLRRLKTDVIDLYQIHWPERNVPAFGALYYDPTQERTKTSIHDQLVALHKLVKQGKVRAIGLSNETPYGVHEFVRVAEQYDLPRIATVQNPYCLISRGLENGLDETMHRLGVSLIPVFAARLRPAHGQVRRKRHRGTGCARRMRASRSTRPCASSAGAGRRRWPPRAATTRWRAPTA